MMNQAAVEQALLAQLAAIQEETAPRPPLSIFRRVLGTVLLMLALLFLGLNMVVLGHFGWGLGQNDIERWVQMIAAGALPVMITAIHPTYVLTWRPGHWFRTHKGAAQWRRGRPNWFLLSTLSLLACVALTINFVGGIGVMSTARKAVALKADDAAGQDRRLKESRQRLEDERASVPKHRPAATVVSLIDAHRLHRFWRATNQCSEDSVLNRAHRDYCAEYGRLRAEHAAAEQAAKLNKELADLDGALSNSFIRVEQQAGVGQMEALGRLSGMSADDLQARLSLLFPILLELMTLVPMVAAMYAFRVDHRALQDVPSGGFETRAAALLPPPAPARSEPPRPLRVMPTDDDMPRVLTGGRITSEDPVRQRAVFDEFWTKRMRRMETGQMAEAKVYALYQTLCAERAVTEMDLLAFRRLSEPHCGGQVELSGSIYYFEVVPA